MPKVRVVAATSNPKTGEPIAAGASVDLDDESYRLLRQQGAVEASEEDQKASTREESEGNYGDRTGRSDTGTAQAEQQSTAPAPAPAPAPPKQPAPPPPPEEPKKK